MKTAIEQQKELEDSNLTELEKLVIQGIMGGVSAYLVPCLMLRNEARLMVYKFLKEIVEQLKEQSMKAEAGRN